MPEEKSPPPEDPRDRFRRLLDEAEKTEDEIVSPAEEDQPQHQPPKDDYPSTYLDLVGSESSEPEVTRAMLAQQRYQQSLRDEDKATEPQEEITMPPPPSLGTTPQVSPPALDTQGMPLPRRVDEIDLGATQVSDIALETVARQRASTPPPVVPPPPPPKPRTPQLNVDNVERSLGCILRMALLGAFIMVVLGLIAGTAGLYVYWQIANDLPDPSDLRARISQFETTRILDRNGNVLYEILDPNAGRRRWLGEC